MEGEQVIETKLVDYNVVLGGEQVIETNLVDYNVVLGGSVLEIFIQVWLILDYCWRKV